MADIEYDKFLTKCANIPCKDYSWLKDHCYRTLKKPCSPNARNEHLAILDLIKEHEEQQKNNTNSVLDKIRAEIEALPKTYPFINHIDTYVKEDDVKRIIDKYKEESDIKNDQR